MRKGTWLIFVVTAAFAFQASELVKIVMAEYQLAPDCPIVGVAGHESVPTATDAHTHATTDPADSCCPTEPQPEPEPDDCKRSCPDDEEKNCCDECPICTMLAASQLFVLGHTADAPCVTSTTDIKARPSDVAVLDHTFSPLQGRAPPAS